MAGLVRGVQDLVVEDGEVEGQAEADRVRGRKFGLRNLGGSLVRLKRLVGRVLALVANGELGQVAVVVTLPVTLLETRSKAWEGSGMYAHLVVKHLALTGLGGRDEVLVKNREDVFADLGELSLDLLAVFLDEIDLGTVALGLLLLLNRGNDSPRRTAGTDDVLVGNRQKIPLLNGKIAVFGGNDLHVVDHLCGAGRNVSEFTAFLEKHVHTLIALGLLGELGQVNSIFVTHFVSVGV